jgi:hypothetical protein
VCFGAKQLLDVCLEEGLIRNAALQDIAMMLLVQALASEVVSDV